MHIFFVYANLLHCETDKGDKMKSSLYNERRLCKNNARNNQFADGYRTSQVYILNFALRVLPLSFRIAEN